MLVDCLNLARQKLKGIRLWNFSFATTTQNEKIEVSKEEKNLGEKSKGMPNFL